MPKIIHRHYLLTLTYFIRMKTMLLTLILTTIIFASEFDRIDTIFADTPFWNVNGSTGDKLTLIRVISKTVGQYTGLKDKNGKKIYEGDVIVYDTYRGTVTWVDLYGSFAVKYAHSECADNSTEPESFVQLSFARRWTTMTDTNYFAEVIGNIHDNPELLVAQK